MSDGSLGRAVERSINGWLKAGLIDPDLDAAAIGMLRDLAMTGDASGDARTRISISAELRRWFELIEQRKEDRPDEPASILDLVALPPAAQE